MAGDDTVQVKFGAQVDGLVAGINNVKSQIENLGGPIGGMVSAFQGLAEAAIAAFAIEGILNYQKSLATLGEQIERTSRMTGLSTGEVQGFRFAVEMTGGDADSAAQSLLRFETNLAKAQAGVGPAAEAYKNLGINLKNADGTLKTISQILPEVAQKFSQTADGATKVEYATALGSRGFAQMIALLDQGKEGLDKLNGILDSTNSKLAPEMVEALAASKRASIEMDTAWKGFFRTIGSTALLDAVNRDMTDLAHEATEVARAVEAAGRAFDKFITGNEDRVASQVETLTAQANKMKALLAGDKNGMFGPQMPASLQKPSLEPLTGKAGGDAKDAKAAEQEQIAIEKSDLATKLEMYKLDEAAKKASDQIKVDSGAMTNAQMLADLKTSLSGEKEAALQEISDEQDLYDSDSAAWEQLNNKKLLVAKQYDIQLQQITLKSTLEQKKQYDQLFTGIKSAMDTMVTGILQGTQTIQQVMIRLADNLAVKFAQLATNKLLDWTKSELQSVTVTQTADAAKVASNTAAAGASDAVGAAHLIKEITSSAAATYAGVFAFLSPEMGPFAAVPAGVAAGTVGAMTGLVSLDVGTPYVLKSGLAMIHEGEAVVTKADNAARGQGGDNYNVTFQINAVDTQSGATFLKNNAATIAQVIAAQSRNFNRNVPAWKS